MIINSPPSPSAIYRRGGALIAVGGLLVMFIALWLGTGGNPPPIVLGWVLATVFQLTVLAATWGALGPGKLTWRIPLSLVWACWMGFSIGLPVWAFGGDPDATWVLAMMMAGLWLLALIPLWLLALLFGVRLRFQEVTGATAKQPRDRQFGICQLMAFTGVVGVVLGVGRLWVAAIPAGDPTGAVGQAMLLLTLAACQLLLSLPLIMACLLPNRVAPAIIGALIFGALITLAELPLIPLLLRARLPPFVVELLIWMNIHSAIWVLVFGAIVRGSRYHVGIPTVEAQPPNADTEPSAPRISSPPETAR